MAEASLNPLSLVTGIVALQFAVFGWRINREISLGEAGRRTWLLASDYINLVLMVAVIFFCIVTPLKTNTFPLRSEEILVAAYVFMGFTPFILAGHYRLFSRLGRTIYDNRPDYPWVTDWEAGFLILALLTASFAAYEVTPYA